MLLLGEEDLYHLVNDSAMITFAIEQDSPPVALDGIQWLFNDTQINDGSRSLSDRYTFSPDLLTLTISSVQHSDEGYYTMIATNAAGFDEDTVSLNIEGIAATE